VLAYLNKQAQIRSQLRTRSKQEIEAQLTSYLSAVGFLFHPFYLTFFISPFLSHPFYLLLASPFAPKGQTSISKEGEIEAKPNANAKQARDRSKTEC
jgi:hypothetical protein